MPGTAGAQPLYQSLLPKGQAKIPCSEEQISSTPCKHPICRHSVSPPQPTHLPCPHSLCQSYLGTTGQQDDQPWREEGKDDVDTRSYGITFLLPSCRNPDPCRSGCLSGNRVLPLKLLTRSQLLGTRHLKAIVTWVLVSASQRGYLERQQKEESDLSPCSGLRDL